MKSIFYFLFLFFKNEIRNWNEKYFRMRNFFWPAHSSHFSLVLLLVCPACGITQAIVRDKPSPSLFLSFFLSRAIHENPIRLLLYSNFGTKKKFFCFVFYLKFENWTNNFFRLLAACLTRDYRRYSLMISLFDWTRQTNKQKKKE